ncbi:MAG: tryptophanase [candidate division WOR-3 bacterium]
MTFFFEPYKIKVVEPIFFTSKRERKKILEKAFYNIFKIPANKITIDLLTDSGTNAMSEHQWSKIMEADESYAGAESFERFCEEVKSFTGMDYVLPCHQGRGAERILAEYFSKKIKNPIVPSNTHFDTTRANLNYIGAETPDFVINEALDPEKYFPFKGNMNTDNLKIFLKKYHKRVPAVFLVLTNNSMAGQPVSFQNVKETREICEKFGIPLFLDISRIAENAYFIKKREEKNKSIKKIIREIISYSDLCYMSAKKDGISNIGGFIAVRDKKLYEELSMYLILWEGFPTYGGLSGRDLEAVAQGLKEATDEKYLEFRIKEVEFLGEELSKRGVPVYKPTGGHAVYVLAERVFDHIKRENFPGQVFSIALYLEGGIRVCEIGSLMHGKDAKFEFVRYAIPRRVYTESHLRYVAEISKVVLENKNKWKGVKLIKESPYLRHFSAEFVLL